MSESMNRRVFLEKSAAAVAATVIAGSAQARAETASSGPAGSGGRLPIKKAVLWNMFPDSVGLEDRFRMAKDIGFEGIEVVTIGDDETVKRMARASEATGVPVHSVLCSGQWGHPLSSSKPEVVATSIANVERSMQNARALGADAVLIVPGVVTPTDAYKDVYARSTNSLRKLADRAAELKVVLAIEDVWNKFLLSPLEFVQFIDQFDSPWVRAYFDIGNVVLYAFPQDWIRTLGHRIVKLHAKDFKREGFQWTPLLEGSVDWKEVRAALREVGYKGYLTAELPGGDDKHLREICGRMTRIVEGNL